MKRPSQLMHTAVGAHAIDSDGDGSYGWLNCVRLKDINNAGRLRKAMKQKVFG